MQLEATEGVGKIPLQSFMVIQHHAEVRDCEKKLIELQMASPLDLQTPLQSNQAMEQWQL
ncbi:hypothetical protein C5167_019372 [Papaver somniferum]|uniref:Uncharacterized protein n=1 Tax=Papaver somniferum TaxID=3469 RepID=A0A4Y7ITZ3_PAPSO|nr:hypothetical protein C5167_019372 [Papaver somniferum]